MTGKENQPMKKGQKGWSVFLTLVLMGLCPGLALAQTTTGIISGTVQDETGGIIPGVDVNVTNVGTGVARTVVSDDEGRYRVAQLPPGDYEVQASLVGFQTVVRSGIHRIGWSLGLNVPTTGGSMFDGSSFRASATLSLTFWAAMSRSVPSANSTSICDAPR